MSASVRIIGIGNPLMGDDGFGIAVVDRLLAMKLPPGIEVIDGGTGGLTLLSLMEGAKRVILVDALDFGGRPGAVLRVSADRLRLPEETMSLSLHQAGLAQVLALGRELGTLPPVVLFGVQQQNVGRRMELSPVVAAALDPVIEGVLRELALP